MIKKKCRKVVYLADYLPITDHIMVFESIWNREVSCSYVRDINGIDRSESGMFGLIALFKQYVINHNNALEVRNTPKQWIMNKYTGLV